MAYSQAWTDNDPVGTDPAKLAWQEMQQIRKDIRERLLTIFTMPDFTSDPLRVGTLNLGYTGATGNAFVNLSNYQGNLQWQFGILQRTSETTLTLRNAILAADAISVAAANNRVTILSGLTITTGGLTISAGDLALAASAANVQLSLSSVGGSGRNYAWISRTTGDFALRDITAGADRFVVAAGGNVTMSAALALGSTLSILGDANKTLSGNATDFTIINDNAAGTIKLRTNGNTRFTLDASGNITLTGGLTVPGSSSFSNGVLLTGGVTVSGSAGFSGGTVSFSNGFIVNASSGFNAVINVNSGMSVPSGSYAAFGTNPATVGFIRMPNSAAIVWRNAANTGNINGIFLDSSDNIQISSDLNISGVYTGNGSGLTALNASNLSSGTISTSRVVGVYANITNVGTLNSLAVNGDVNLSGTGIVNCVSVSASATIAVGTLTMSNTGLTMFDNGSQIYIGQTTTRTKPHLVLQPMSSTPGSLVDGAIWNNASGWFVRLAGVTKQIQLI